MSESFDVEVIDGVSSKPLTQRAVIGFDRLWGRESGSSDSAGRSSSRG